jgi:hypothetical protein
MRNYRFAFIAACILALSGCTIDASCEFTNSSNKDIKLELVSAQETQNLGVLRIGETRRIQFWRRVMVRISSGDTISEYQTPEPPAVCAEVGGWGYWLHRTFKAELKTDGRIHLVCTEQSNEFPVFPIRGSGA